MNYEVRKNNLHVKSPLIFQLLGWTLCGRVPGLHKDHKSQEQSQDVNHHLGGPVDDAVEGDGAALLSLLS